MGRALLLVVLLVTLTGCATAPDGAYFPEPSSRTTAVASALYRAAQAAGDDPTRYSFALIKTRDISAFSGEEDATFYFSDGLAALPGAAIDALVAREVAHEVLGHAGHRRALSMGITGTFIVLGIIVPGLSMADWVVNPLIVRAFTRDQVIAADLRSIEIIRSMGHELPRRTLVGALRAVEATNGAHPGGLLATVPPLADRLAAIGVVEPTAELAQQNTVDGHGPSRSK
jgi:Zn-dependent protease with chaperone function